MRRLGNEKTKTVRQTGKPWHIHDFRYPKEISACGCVCCRAKGHITRKMYIYNFCGNKWSAALYLVFSISMNICSTHRDDDLVQCVLYLKISVLTVCAHCMYAIELLLGAYVWLMCPTWNSFASRKASDWSKSHSMFGTSRKPNRLDHNGIWYFFFVLSHRLRFLTIVPWVRQKSSRLVIREIRRVLTTPAVRYRALERKRA